MGLFSKIKSMFHKQEDKEEVKLIETEKHEEDDEFEEESSFEEVKVEKDVVEEKSVNIINFL